MNIDGIWKRIDLLDDVLLRIFNEWARLALEIEHVKKELGLPCLLRVCVLVSLPARPLCINPPNLLPD